VKLVRLRKPKIVCSPSDAVFRSRAKEVIFLDLGHMLRGEHITGRMGVSRKPKI
jgi:hypothetical protein